MIVEFITRDFHGIMLKLTVISISWSLVISAIIVDLFFGVKKAKQIGDKRTSEGYRRSISKFQSYFSVLFFAFLFDALLPVSVFFSFPISAIPIVTVIASLALVLTEYKSVREKADEKARRRIEESTRQIIDFLKNKDENIIDKIQELTKKD